LRVKNIIYKHDKDIIVHWGKLHISKQTCVCLIHSVYTKCENGCACAFAKSNQAIGHHHGSAVCTQVKKHLSPQLNTMVG